MIQALADVTGRRWAARSRRPHGRNASVLEEHSTPKARSEPQAERRMIPKESTDLGTMTRDVENTVGDDHAGVEGGSVDPKECRTCNAIVAVSHVEGVPENQRPRLNAAPLSMVQGVADPSGGEGVADTGVLEAMETLSQVGLRVLLSVRPTLRGGVWQNFGVGGCPTSPPPPRVGWDFVGALGSIEPVPLLSFFC